MDEWYANIHRTLIISLFYARVLPFAMLFGCAAIVVQYWSDKGFLVYRHARPIVQGHELAEHMTCFFSNAILFFTLGQIIWDYILIGHITT